MASAKRGRKSKRPADTMTVEEAAERLRIGRNQAYEGCKSGRIPAVRVGRRWLIPIVAFDRMLLSGGGATAK